MSPKSSPNDGSWDAKAVVGIAILAFLAVVSVVAAFPNSPRWTWEIAKLGILFFSVITAAGSWSMIQESGTSHWRVFAAGFFIGLASIAMVLIHYLFERVRFPKLAWQVLDIYSPLSTILFMFIARRWSRKE